VPAASLPDAVISLANRDSTPNFDMTALISRYGKGDQKLEHLFKELIADRGEETERHRAFAVQMLQSAAVDRNALVAFTKTWHELEAALDLSLTPDLSKIGPGKIQLRWRPTLGTGKVEIKSGPTNFLKEIRFTPEGFVVQRAMWPSPTETWINFAAILILAAPEEDPIKIGRCALQQCGRFFRIERKGRGLPSRRYCPGSDHMEKAHAQGSTERSRLKRIRDAREASKGPRRKK
jgi:hypothetical protein